MQYVEGLNGETARRSRVSALAAEAPMNNTGRVSSPVRGLFESQDGLEREADERVRKDAEQNHASDGTGQHER